MTNPATPPNTQSTNQASRPPGPASQTMQPGFWHGVSITDVLNVILAALLVWIAFWQIELVRDANRIAGVAASSAQQAADATTVSVDLTREGMQKELRAYMSIVRGEVTGVEDKAGPIKIKLTFKNSGQTPALEVRGAMGIRCVDYPITDTPQLQNDELSPPMALGAGVESFMFGELDSMLRPDIKSGSKVVQAFGIMRYKDVFGKPHEERFNLIQGGDPGTEFSPFMGLAPEGNESN